MDVPTEFNQRGDAAPPPMTNPSTRLVREPSPMTMHSAWSRWLCPLFGIAAAAEDAEDTTAKVLPLVIFLLAWNEL